MGGTSSKYDRWRVRDDALSGTRYDQIVLVDDRYVLPVDEPMRKYTLQHISGLSLSGYYLVFDAQSRKLVFSTKGRVFGLKEFEVVDVRRNNTPVVDVYAEPSTALGLTSKFEFRRPCAAIAPDREESRGETLATIRIDGRLAFNLDMTMSCQVTRPDCPANITLKIKGESYSVFLGHPMDRKAVLLARATVDRKLLTGDTMELTIAPGIDAAGMVALCVLADEAQRQLR
ncbi:hypothetical protein AMAG_07114 [Allomyces macrogynus ATCC 38327]|uniref:Tubby C-terminal domain-containing protein n=1 Tax=Allomyces macrogynus (strain ATCC 38327) TaxID=578462 RepID=A0A0L0SH50_ALLM3|nr:hypothetical protein AMAG_07114 [Allomyces macrogynus ATCC 38327]|eukprot:KNE61838.1 hypothetical protein AMAG_07114 [Allomyces macrogynus ATCC 38327]